MAVNDPFGDAHTMAFLLKHDSVGGTIPNEIKVDGNGFSIDGAEIKKLEVREPSEIPWGDNGVDVVIESTGLFTARDKAAAHLEGGAQRVVISAPAGDADVMICMGRERRRLRPEGAHRHLQRLVHHQLPGADDPRAARALRHRAGLHHDGARLHERSAAPGPGGRNPFGQARPAAHARRRAVDHPELHRSGARDRAR